MSLSAITLPAEDLYLLTDLGQTRLSHPALPAFSQLASTRHIALHAAATPPDPCRLERGARWLGWSVSPGLGMPRDGKCRSVLILRPDTERTRRAAERANRNLRAVDLRSLPRGAVVAVAPLLAERTEPHTGPVWYLGPLVILPAPIPVDTEDWPIGRPWTVLPPTLGAVRQQWKAAQRRVPIRRSA